jgi:hypothetical protein
MARQMTKPALLILVEENAEKRAFRLQLSLESQTNTILRLNFVVGMAG